MNQKEKFMLFVFLSALAGRSRNAFELAACANRIPEGRIPPNAMHAAMVFVHHMDRGSSGYRWMRNQSVNK